MKQETIDIVRHIFQARIDNARLDGRHEEGFVYQSALDIFNYAVEDNVACLGQFDYLPTRLEMDIRARGEEYYNDFEDFEDLRGEDYYANLGDE